MASSFTSITSMAGPDVVVVAVVVVVVSVVVFVIVVVVLVVGSVGVEICSTRRCAPCGCSWYTAFLCTRRGGGSCICYILVEFLSIAW